MKLKLTMVYQKVPEGGYVAFVEEIPGVNTQGKNLREAKTNLLDALKLTLEFHRDRIGKKFSRKKKGIIREEFELVSV
ncbi:MAG TPA: type II toxin-antitoxin system HicB family antitoxin [Bacteroidia bacterium]|nr:type II toxin-antitoxin system HicB family antitoxin [Bacteroidia bacterium]